jgi:hypothetical protein
MWNWQSMLHRYVHEPDTIIEVPDRRDALEPLSCTHRQCIL